MSDVLLFVTFALLIVAGAGVLAWVESAPWR